MSSAPAKLETPQTTNSVLWTGTILYGSITTLGTAADLWTKQWVFGWLGLPGENKPWWLIQDYVGIETAVNIGALFGMGAGYGWIFAALSILAAIGILIWLFAFGAIRDRWLACTTGCVTAGILGNLYDRLGLWYQPGMPIEWRSAVRDWILFRYGEYTWPNFNIADSLLVCGAIMLAVHSFKNPPSTTTVSESKPQDSQRRTST